MRYVYVSTLKVRGEKTIAVTTSMQKSADLIASFMEDYFQTTRDEIKLTSCEEDDEWTVVSVFEYKERRIYVVTEKWAPNSRLFL